MGCGRVRARPRQGIPGPAGIGSAAPCPGSIAPDGAAYQATESLLLTFDERAFSGFRASNTTAGDGHLNLRGPGYAIFDIGAVYAWDAVDTRQSLGITVKNLLDRKKYVLVNSMVPGNGLGVYVTYRIRH